ncbi:MAG TPA: hypothetical protein VJI15_02960 [Candidatus Nanoarchaeia archaeon]|nr:hypothetical protein [Candidatus Nanoarchaeia archaeon]
MSDFYFARNLESVAGVRYNALNDELAGAEASIRFGPAVIDGRVRPDSPIVGLYVGREIPGAPNLADALAEVRDHKLDELSHLRAEDEGMH